MEGIKAGKTGYAPGAGILPLREALAEDIGATIQFLPGQEVEGQAFDFLHPYHRRNMPTLNEIGAPGTIEQDRRIGYSGSFGGAWTAAVCEAP